MNRVLIFILAFSFLLTFSNTAHAQQATEYNLRAPSRLEPSGWSGGDKEDCKTTAGPYSEGIFMLTIAIATGLAVLTIIYGGIQYISTDAIGGKSEAKGTIEHAIWGLLLAIGAWLILNTISPNLVNFDLNIKQQIIAPTPVPTSTAPTTSPSPTPSGVCKDCVTVGVTHKPAPNGCEAPGPCQINSKLNGKLQFLDLGTNFLVTEAYPPTIAHRDGCHTNGTCVDATISSNTAQNIKIFIESANTAGLRAVFEIPSTQTGAAARAQSIRNATGLSASQVIVWPVLGEHFSVYCDDC